MYCQECRIPLKLDGSLNELNPAAFKLLVESTGGTSIKDKSSSRHDQTQASSERRKQYDLASSHAKDPKFKRTVGSSRHASTTKTSANGAAGHAAPDMSFIMLTDSMMPESPSSVKSTSNRRRRSSFQPAGQISEEDSLSDRMETATRLFEILSSRSDIDHPICVECTERLVEQLQKRLSNSTKERDAYIEFLRQANADVPTDEDLAQARRDLKHLQKQERDAFAELERLEKEKADMEAEIRTLDVQARELDLEEETFWAERNEFAQKLSSAQSERDRLNTQCEHDSKQLERLRRANVYNDTFPIGHDGFFGTINGLRLGRLPERPVDWGEINAAWGHTCLLLATVAEKLGFVFQGYELVPMGSTSRIRVFKTPRNNAGEDATRSLAASGKGRYDTYKLYYDASPLTTLGMNLFHSEFDTAMIAFLACLSQLIQHAQSNPIVLADGSTVECPRINYKIERDKIGEHSIRLSGLGGNEESWTKACKLALICCKYLLAHASNVGDRSGRSR